MSPTLLSKRLHQLVLAGVVERHEEAGQVRYLLTQAGRELAPVVEAIGAWGVRWIGELGEEDLDPKLLLWDMHRNVDHTAVPGERTVVHFAFTDVPARHRHWWLVINPDDVEVCDVDPGFDEAVVVEASLRRMVRVWRGDLRWAEALRTGGVVVRGPESLRRAVPHWFSLSSFAGVPRPTHQEHSSAPALADA
jgi:hypothetical protein